MKFVSKLLNCLLLLMCILVYGKTIFIFSPVVSDMETKTMFVMDGDSVTLQYGIWPPFDEDGVLWRTKDFVAERMGYRDAHFRDICKDILCKDHNKRLKDRLNRDGSLTLTNTTVTDSGEYNLMIQRLRGGDSSGFYLVIVPGFFSFDTDGVSVMEGDSVTLHTGEQTNQERSIEWYFNSTHIAKICEYPCLSCTDVQCNKGNERFRDRLKLDHQTGSLTITTIRTTDSGLYTLQISSSRFSIMRSFSVTVNSEYY
ncbi:uncharacterized protein LOC132159067 [Carassius carassius]|uniref:uncharacterized protein LOC132159067 n=1 Tax=Carassius carassius TaxID=217509 RepID=UPI0028689606|nr:uncharacterized protein LOC132159067 [Carassius carassius]